MNAVLFALVIARCGFRFSVPDGWHSALATVDNDAVVCGIDLQPPHWPSPKPRWPLCGLWSPDLRMERSRVPK